jgi:hypothetical protein
MFQTDKKGTVVTVSGDTMERATALLQDSSAAIAEAGTKELSQAASSVLASTSAPQFTATFTECCERIALSIMRGSAII